MRPGAAPGRGGVGGSASGGDVAVVMLDTRLPELDRLASPAVSLRELHKHGTLPLAFYSNVSDAARTRARARTQRRAQCESRVRARARSSSGRVRTATTSSSTGSSKPPAAPTRYGAAATRRIASCPQ